MADPALVEQLNSVTYLCLRAISEPDKTAIKAAIKNGETVTGAEIVERYNLQIK